LVECRDRAILPARFSRSARWGQQGLPCSVGEDPAAQGFQGVISYGVDRGARDLQELGATCLYLNPVFASKRQRTLHTSSISRWTRCWGANGALAFWWAELPSPRQRLILDGVFTTAAAGFLAFHTCRDGVRLVGLVPR